jgi:uncharacterized membrane protein
MNGWRSHFTPRAAWIAMRARPMLMASIAVGFIVYLGLRWHGDGHPQSRSLLAWNTGEVMFLLLSWRMMHRAQVQVMRERALTQDPGRLLILLLTVLAAAAVLLAVGTQLATMRQLRDEARTLHIGLAALTVFTSWLFTQVLFAFHYAHDFYAARVRGEADPLVFPGTPDPLYADFVYFACVIGTSGQTADVPFNSTAIRRVGALHCVLAFFFNATLLALAINIAAGLLV